MISKITTIFLPSAALFVAILLIVAVSVKYYYRNKKINLASGFLIFEIDNTLKRARINNDIEALNFLPEAIANLQIKNGEWFELDTFFSIFAKENKKKIIDLINSKNKLNFNEKFDVELESYNENTIKYKLLLEKGNNFFIATLSWTNHFIKEISEKINIVNTNNYLETIKHKAFVIYLHLNILYIFKINYLMNQLISIIYNSKIKEKISILNKNDRLFIYYQDESNFTNSEIPKQQILNLLKKFKVLCNYFDISILLEKTLIKQFDENKFTLFSNYLLFEKSTNKLTNCSLIDNNLLNLKQYLGFAKQYAKTISLINNEDYTIEKSSLYDYKSEETLINIVAPSFSKDYLIKYNEIISKTEILDYLWLSFFKNIKKYKLNDSIIIINDYIFSLLNVDYLKKIWKNFKYLQICIKINNKNNYKYLAQKIKDVINVGYSVGIRISEIEENLLNFVSDVFVKFIIIDKDISKNLNITKNVVLINTLVSYIKEKNITTIFEELNIENYKKLINTKDNTKIMYIKHN